jgi:SAM-dependent methyltransferase
VAPDAAALDRHNADFWDELCGSGLARSIGATGRTQEDLRRFDDAYMALYPYLYDYLPQHLEDTHVLEIGLGYGTLGQLLAERGALYTGVDISPGPVAMMHERLMMCGAAPKSSSLRASAAALPFETGAFDFVYSIGCLHHTGALPAAVGEVYRVLRPGGRAVVMLYNAHSARRVVLGAVDRLRSALRPPAGDDGAAMRARYDADAEGEAAPHTDFVSPHEVRDLFSVFREVDVDRRNLSAGRIPVPRDVLLRSRLDRLVGLDLYIRATR